MKKIILFVFLSIFLASPCFAGGVGVSGVGMSGGAGGATYDHEVKCEDNAASTTVVNDSDTGKANWTASANTSTITDGDCAEGSASFYIDTENFFSGENYTDETFTLTFHFKPDSETPAANKILMSISDGDPTVEQHEFVIMQKSGTDELLIYGYGATGSESAETSDCNLSSSAWQELKFVVDASGADWTVTITKDGGSVTLGAWSGSPGAATFNSLWFGGCTTSTYTIAGRIDHIRIEP